MIVLTKVTVSRYYPYNAKNGPFHTEWRNKVLLIYRVKASVEIEKSILDQWRSITVAEGTTRIQPPLPYPHNGSGCFHLFTRYRCMPGIARIVLPRRRVVVQRLPPTILHVSSAYNTPLSCRGKISAAQKLAKPVDLCKQEVAYDDGSRALFRFKSVLLFPKDSP